MVSYVCFRVIRAQRCLLNDLAAGPKGGRSMACSCQSLAWEGKEKEERQSWSGVLGFGVAIWGLSIYNSKEGALNMQESWSPQEVRSKTKDGGTDQGPGSERKGSSCLAPHSWERGRVRGEVS